MALGTPVAAAAAYSANGGTTVSPAYPASILATDVVLLFVGQKPDTANGGTVTTPTGWTLRDELLAAGGHGATLGADTGNTNLRVYSWNAPVAGQTGNLSVTLGANNMAWAFIVRIPTSGGALSYGSADGARTTAPTVNVPFDVALTNGTTATNFQSGDLAIWAMCIPTDVTTPAQFSAQSVTATGATFGAATEINEPDNSLGNDIGGYSAWASVTANSSTAAPTVTVTAGGTVTNVRGPVVLLRVREAGGTTYNNSATETGSAADSSTSVEVNNVALTETGSTADSASSTVSGGTTYNDSTAETGSAADSSTSVEVNNVGLTETGSAADSSTSVEVNNVALTETGSTADSSSRTLVMSSLAADTQSAADTSLASRSAVGNVTETSFAVDSSACSSVQVSTAAETLSATDASNQIVSVPLIGGLINSDVLNRLTLNGTGPLEFVNEAVSLADSATTLSSQTAAVSESVSVADSSTRIGTQTLTVSEAAAASDAVLAQLPSVQVGGLINSDVLNLLPLTGSPPETFSETRTESLAGADSSAVTAGRVGAVAETSSVSDSSTRTGVQVGAVTETAATASTQVSAVPGSTAVLEIVAAAETLSATVIETVSPQPQWITAVESGVLSADAEPLTVIVANTYIGYLRAAVEVIYPETNVQPQYIIAA